jgi:protein TonB
VRIPVPAAYAVSAALHAVAFLGVSRAPALPPAGQAVSVEIVEVAPPPPAPVPLPPPVAVPLPPPVVQRRAPRSTPLAPPREAPVAPAAPATPPPPNDEPPPDAPPPEKAPVRVGVSLSSSTTGGVAAPAGNTMYGEMPTTAPNPGDVKPYRSERYVPPTQVTVLPRLLGECRPPTDEYPQAALRLGIEGSVVLVLTVDETGSISDARVIEDPGHGLGPAAVASVRHCRFQPARRGADAVATSFRFKIRFELP